MWRSSLQLVTKRLIQRREFKVRRHTVVPHQSPSGVSSQGSLQTVSELPPENGYHIGKAVAFTVGATCTFYTGAAIWVYERYAALHYQAQTPRLIWPPSRANVSRKAGSIRQQINEWWRHQSPGHRTFYGIFALNTVVLALWHIPRFGRVMSRYFCHSATSSNVLPMILSTFSHSSPVHFMCNMYVLYSFSDSVISLIGQEQFVATYLSAGVISSLASQFHQVARRMTFSSLGASGAIMGIVGLVCSAVPDARLSIVFLPMLTFTAGNAIKALLVFDAAGIALRWRLFDHAAHIGGLLFGIGFAMGGHAVAAQYQKSVFEKWRQIRSQ
ncbi:presenilins-associated rhomboid protein [Tropilaelaps mercedesae]|uniref:rhomboid protease n=1 Tax=Tropilaelaps mercedesae TaxID=418985 RepID=A0A1V9XWM8_9ACAR|nr:presenilins-associated rhomboid protein [Tropilaelaps mercedesae]